MKLFFRKSGKGPDLVILHGLFGSSDNWTTIARSLSDRFTVYLPDLRNHGNSPHSEIHDYSSMADDIYQFATGNNLKKFFLAGHSMGGKTAVKFALEWPELLNGLIVADISPFETGRDNPSSFLQHQDILKIIAGTDISQAISRSGLESIFSTRIKSPAIRGFILKNIKRDDDGNFTWKINISALMKNLGKIADSVVPPDRSITPVSGFPVLFLRGEHSGYLPEGDFGRILSLFPAAEFKTIKNAGHWMHSDNPAEVTGAISGMLTAQDQ